MTASPRCLYSSASSNSIPDKLPASQRGLPRVLAIGGSDSSAGAGIQADLQSITANGAHPVLAVTAVTAQHSRGVTASFPLAPEAIEAQLEAACADTAPAAVKTGMMVNQPTVEAVARHLRSHPAPVVVVDPVIHASSDAELLDECGIEALRGRLLPLATLVTPNVREAEVLAGMSVRTLADVEAAGRRILSSGVSAVLVTGGHLDVSPATDVLITPDGVHTFEGSHLPGRNVHGTGCAYASAIAVHLAHGCAIEDAICSAKRYVEAIVNTAVHVGPGALMADHHAATQMMSAQTKWPSSRSSAGWQ